MEGVKTAVELAEEVNARVKRPQIRTLDIGGGWPVHYRGDAYTSEKVGTSRIDTNSEAAKAVRVRWVRISFRLCYNCRGESKLQTLILRNASLRFP